MKSHIEQIVSLLCDGVDAILLTGIENRRYACGYSISEGMVLISRQGSRYYTDSRYLEDAETNIASMDVRLVSRENSYAMQLKEAVKEWNLAAIGYEEGDLTAGQLLALEKELGISMKPMQREISAFRSVKEPWELECIARAQAITDQTFSDILDVVRPGMTEKELRYELIYRLYKNGAEGLSFSPIIVSGPNTSLPHGVAGDRKLQNGDFVTMDFGCKWNGYCSDMTRTVALGSVTEEMQTVYNTVLAAQLAGLGATRSGVLGCEVDAAARKVIEDAGFGDYFGHGYGHGIGLEVHEMPSCNSSWDKPLLVNSVCSAEPGIYLPGKFGVRIEDMVVVKENGILNLTKSPKSLIIL